MHTYIDRNRIEIAIRCIRLDFLRLYQCYHEACMYKYWLIPHWLPSFSHQFPISVVTFSCHWAYIVNKTILELFQPVPNNHDFHLHNRLEHDTRQQKLFFLSDRLRLLSME